MLNLKDVSGVESAPISKSILENSLGTNSLKDSRAYSNYEFLLNSLKSGGFKAPSVIMASGEGTFYPKNTAYTLDFYSAFILGRDGYNNSWLSSHGKDNSYGLSYYDGSVVFKSLNIDPSTGKGKIRALELRNGNLPNESGLVQFLLGYNANASTDESGYYRHNFRTRHSTLSNSENVIDIFLWDKNSDSRDEIGSRRVFSLYGSGSVEIVSGTEIFGPVNIAIETPAEKAIEQSTLAQAGKGVIYYNDSKDKFRYSENGGPFQYFGGSASEALTYESIPLKECAPFNGLGINIADPEAFGVFFFAENEIEISGVSTVLADATGAHGALQFAIYSTTYYTAGSSIPMIPQTGDRTLHLEATGEIQGASQSNVFSTGNLADSVTVKGWFCVVFSNTPMAAWPILQAAMNNAELMAWNSSQYVAPLQFIRTGLVNPNEPSSTMWPDETDILYRNDTDLINKNIIPYVKLEIA